MKLTQEIQDRILLLLEKYSDAQSEGLELPFIYDYVVEKILEEKIKEMNDKLESIETDDSTQREYGLGIKSGLRQAIDILRN